MPAATTVMAAGCPAVTLWMVGCIVIVGTIAAEVPVPRSVMTVVGVCGSLLVVVILPESLPTVVGENDPSNLTVPPGAIVLGVF